MATVEYAEVVLWGKAIAAVAWNEERQVANFEYMPEFQESGIQLAPLRMPLSSQVYSFPALPQETFYCLPGLLADCLPDKFGNLLIDQWLTNTGRSKASFTSIHRLCYVGTRGMGALEFRPILGDRPSVTTPLEIAELVELANEALTGKEKLRTKLGANDDEALDAMQSILSVGISAGGARAKAVIAWNEQTGEIRSGQTDAADGFTQWLLKFDGVSKNRDKELADPRGYGRIEYAYHLMAKDAGINMTRCRLLEENGRSHFVTQRFDRNEKGQKEFMQSLCGLGHFDFNHPGAYSYEQAIQVATQLEVPAEDVRQLFRRMAFNVVARNQDDHTKNIAFIMSKSGKWRLSPAYDVTYSYNPDGDWTGRHQMTVNQKRDNFDRVDLLHFGERFRVIGRLAKPIVEEVEQAVSQWMRYADAASVETQWAREIGSNHRLNLK